MYLVDKGMLEVKDESGKVADFQSLLHCYEAENENAWVSYIVYRDLRSRGYVAREGFGAELIFACTSEANTAKTPHPTLC